MAYIMEQAGGKASTGKIPILGKYAAIFIFVLKIPMSNWGDKENIRHISNIFWKLCLISR